MFCCRSQANVRRCIGYLEDVLLQITSCFGYLEDVLLQITAADHKQMCEDVLGILKMFCFVADHKQITSKCAKMYCILKMFCFVADHKQITSKCAKMYCILKMFCCRSQANVRRCIGYLEDVLFCLKDPGVL